MSTVFQALAEPRRVEILRLVRNRELPAGEIALHFDVTRPAVSQHLRTLLDAGLLRERREGQKRLYRVRPEGFRDLRNFLFEFWDESLERLKSAAEQTEKRERGKSRKRE